MTWPWCGPTSRRTGSVARSRYLRVSPYTIVAADLRELRDALEPARVNEPDPLTPGQPNIARMYDYLLGGKDHVDADRAALDAVLEAFPEVTDVARANRAFLTRAVRYLARKGVSQFVDLGSGLPASPNVHETAREVNPGARVVYVDRDPVVLAHARALLAVDNNGGVVAGDARDPAGFLAEQALTGLIDVTEPAGVLLLSVLQFLTPAQAHAVVGAFREWMAPGSYLVISAGTSTGTDPGLVRALRDACSDTAQVTGHTAAEIRAWFGGLSLVRPGLVNVWAWRPDTSRQPRPARVRFLGGVARKPGARRPPVAAVTPSQALSRLHVPLAEHGIIAVGMDFGKTNGTLIQDSGQTVVYSCGCSGGPPGACGTAGRSTRSTPPPTRAARPAGSPAPAGLYREPREFAISEGFLRANSGVVAVPGRGWVPGFRSQGAGRVAGGPG